MITSDNKIRPFRVRKFAVLDAMNCYCKFKKVKIWGAISFWVDVVDHLINGFVISRPDLFWMGKIINVSKTDKIELAWFIRMCLGDLNELLDTLPIVVNKIAFCRRDDGRVRIYSIDKFIKGVRAGR